MLSVMDKSLSKHSKGFFLGRDNAWLWEAAATKNKNQLPMFILKTYPRIEEY